MKLFAALLMVFDHIAVIFFPSLIIMRIPGRLSFPIFAYYTAIGATNTKKPNIYFFRLLIFAIIAQPVYSALPLGESNILFSLLYGAIVVRFWAKATVFSFSAALIMIGACVTLDNLSYGWYGIITILFFHITQYQPARCFAAQGILQIVYFLVTTDIIQPLCLLATPLLHKPYWPKITLPRYFFYIFYPLHLAVLYLIYLCI